MPGSDRDRGSYTEGMAAPHATIMTVTPNPALDVSTSVDEVVANAHLTTYTVTGPGLAELADILKHKPGVDMVAPFGTALHVSGRDQGALEAAVDEVRARGQWVFTPGEPTLEDVFIDLMSRSKDNFA